MNNTAVQLQPFLTDALQFLFVVVVACAVPAANALYGLVSAKLNLQSNATARSMIDGVTDSAVAYAQKYASAAVTKVGPIDVGNATVAAAANFVLSHAPDELAQLGYTESHVIDLVRSYIQQLGNPTTTEKSA